MNLEKVYHDVDGNELNILQLVKKDPEWAANVLQHYECCVENLEYKKERLLEALQSAFKKHVCNDDSIGWDELSDIMSCALPEAMGDPEYCEFLEGIDGAERWEKR